MDDIANPKDIAAERLEMAMLKLARMFEGFTFGEITRQVCKCRLEMTPAKARRWVKSRPNIFERKNGSIGEIWQIRADAIQAVDERITILHAAFLPELIAEVRERHPDGLHEDGKFALEVVLEYLGCALDMARHDPENNKDEIADNIAEALPFILTANAGFKRAARFTLSPAPAYIELIERFRAVTRELQGVVPRLNAPEVRRAFDAFLPALPAETVEP